jgi:hypothetical protein
MLKFVYNQSDRLSVQAEQKTRAIAGAAHDLFRGAEESWES